MAILRYSSILACCLLLAMPVAAQVPAAAAKKYNEAIAYRLKRSDSLAYKAMREAIDRHPSYAEAYSTLGEWYFTDRKYSAAVDLFTAASRNCKGGPKSFALPLARSLVYDYKPIQALQLVNTYGHNGSTAEWEKLRKQAPFMMQALISPLKDSVYNLGPRINTVYPELHPFIAPDTQKLYYTRMVRNMDMECYMTVPDSCGGWFSGGNLGAPVNTPDHEAAQMVSADGHYLFYMRCDNRSENGWDQGGCDLFMAYTSDSVWSIGLPFGATINTPYYEGMPCLSPDNRDLYFVSDKPGGYGGLDIWVSRFEDGLWQMPHNMGPHINTPGDETAPFIHIDNKTLYFSSDGHTGMGGADLYYCRRVNDTTWSAPVNLGYPINTTGNEGSISITMDGRKAYFSSDRDSLEGNYDIYETRLDERVQPVPVVVLKGYTYDSLIKSKLSQAALVINDAQTGERLYRYVSNRGDGSYMMTLPAGKNYKYVAHRIGYIEVTGDIMLADSTPGAKPISFNVPMLPQSYVAPIYDSLIMTIRFPINSKTLNDSAKSAIQNAILPWLEETGFVLLVNGYTDNTGTPILNEELSAMRAKMVADELMSYGISEFSIIYQGWGEAAPVASNDTEIGRDLNRRVEVVIRR